jgi:hypothetical protein
MAEPSDLLSVPAGRALALLRRARVDLDHLERVSAENGTRRQLVVSVADRLGALSREGTCPQALAVLLQDWRDRLGSHVLVAEALAELEVHPDLADQMVRRGLVGVIEEAPTRLAADPARASRATAGG